MSAQTTTAIIAWKKLSRRSELLAKALDAKLWFFSDDLPYVRAFLRTLRKVISQKPKTIIVQLPQGPLLLEALILKKLAGCKVVTDVHTGFLLSTDWKGLLLNSPFIKLLRYADLVTAHNDAQLDLIPANARGKTIVVFDPWHLISEGETSMEIKQESYIVFPASFASDEPLEEVINSIVAFNINVKMYITGNWKRRSEIMKYASERIVFTGFLTNKEFNNLLAQATAIITGTKREYTSLMSGWEAVAYGKPLAVTGTRTLKNVFENYAIFYDYRNSESIAHSINELLHQKPNTSAREKLKNRTIKSFEKLEQKMKELD